MDESGDLRTFRHGPPKIHPPVILGHEFAGVVVEVGADAQWGRGVCSP
ncbi:alcohol dehydrogenase catalytic domain-containing protein [Selenomonas felix]